MTESQTFPGTDANKPQLSRRTILGRLMVATPALAVMPAVAKAPAPPHVPLCKRPEALESERRIIELLEEIQRAGIVNDETLVAWQECSRRYHEAIGEPPNLPRFDIRTPIEVGHKRRAMIEVWENRPKHRRLRKKMNLDHFDEVNRKAAGELQRLGDELASTPALTPEGFRLKDRFGSRYGGFEVRKSVLTDIARILEA